MVGLCTFAHVPESELSNTVMNRNGQLFSYWYRVTCQTVVKG